MYYTPQWFKRMERWLGDSSLRRWSTPGIMKPAIVTFRQFIETIIAASQIFEIYPPKPLHSIALGSRIRRCVKIHKSCCFYGRYFLATVGKLLTEKAPLTRHLVPQW